MSRLKFKIEKCEKCGAPYGFCICKPVNKFERTIKFLTDKKIEHEKFLPQLYYEVSINIEKEYISELQQAIEVLEKEGEK